MNDRLAPPAPRAPLTRHQRAMQILASARRLEFFCRGDKPLEVIVEAERHLLLTKLAGFPADPRQIAVREQIKDDVYASEQEFLRAHGFYDSALGDFAGDQQPPDQRAT